MWSSRILVTRFFAIVRHPALCSQTRLRILHNRLSWVSPGRADEFVAGQRWLVPGTAQTEQIRRRADLPKRTRCPPLLAVHESGCCFEGLPIQGSATPRTVRNLLGVGLASVVVIEEHPFVLPTNPPELPPEIPPLRARTHQTSHQSSSSANMCVDSNLHNKTRPALWRP